VDTCHNSSGLLLKLEAYDKFLKKNPGLRNNIVLLQIIKYDKCDLINQYFETQLDEALTDLSKNYGDTVIHVIKVEKFSVEERFALLSLGDVLFYLQVREGNCMVFYPFNLLVCK
jgi:trehalose-6-phosphate synthase